jgi:hypothetical protein
MLGDRHGFASDAPIAKRFHISSSSKRAACRQPEVISHNPVSGKPTIYILGRKLLLEGI